MLRALFGLTLGFAAFVTSSAGAVEFSELRNPLHNADPKVGVIEARGLIVAGDAERLQAMFLRLKRPSYLLMLNSLGGKIIAALEVAHMMDNFTVDAIVPKGATCASACAQIIYISARIHTVAPGGRLGVHSCSAVIKASSPIFKGPSPAQKGEFSNSDAACNAMIEINAMAYGTPPDLLLPERILRHDKVLWLDAEEAECWGLVKRGPETPSAPCITNSKFRQSAH